MATWMAQPKIIDTPKSNAAKELKKRDDELAFSGPVCVGLRRRSSAFIVVRRNGDMLNPPNYVEGSRAGNVDVSPKLTACPTRTTDRVDDSDNEMRDRRPRGLRPLPDCGLDLRWVVAFRAPRATIGTAIRRCSTL